MGRSVSQTHLAPLCASLLAVAVGCASAPPRATAVDAGAFDRRVADPVGLRYRDTGGDGPALVLVHGNFDALETWARVVPLLKDHFRVITLDLPGFGESDNPFGSWEYAALAIGIRLVMDDAGVERAILVGNSLGGGVAATFAAHYPERVAGLGLEDANFLRVGITSPRPELMAKLGPVFQAAHKRAAKAGDEAAARALRDATRAALLVALPAEGAVDDALVEHFARGFEGTRFEAVKGVNAATMESLDRLSADFAQAFKARDLPMAILWGLDDPFLPVENADVIKAHHPTARLVLFDGCGHAPHLERPAELAAAIVGTFGPSPTQTDVYVASPNEALQYPGWLNQFPFIDRAIRRTLTEGAHENVGELPWLALNQLATGQFDAALATVTRFPKGWHEAHADYVAGAVHEVRGDQVAAAASHVKALRAMEPDQRGLALARLARLPLDPAQAGVVDGFLDAPPGESEPIAMLLARVDRLLARERWEDALALLDRYAIEVPFKGGVILRRAIAEWGASREPTDRTERAIEAQFDVHRHRLATASEWTTLLRIERCRGAIAEERERFDGVAVMSGDRCEPTDVGRLDFMSGPPPVVAGGDARGTALGAIALANTALVTAHDAEALAELEAVPDERATQTPELHRLRLAISAATGQRGAVTKARALVATHGEGLAWRRVLATTLGAAGKLRESRDMLVALIVLAPSASLREELAYVEAALGRIREARALLATLRKTPDWRGSPTRFLPHLRAHALRTWTAP